MFEFLLALLTTVTVAALLVPLLRRHLDSRDRLASDTAVYRDQLAEVERERAAGTLSLSDAAAARTEIERRLLAAAERDQALGPRHSDGAISVEPDKDARSESRAPSPRCWNSSSPS